MASGSESLIWHSANVLDGHGDQADNDLTDDGITGMVSKMAALWD